MPRKRKADPLDDSSVTSSPGKLKTKKSGQIDSLFDKYASGSVGMIDPEGIETLCSHLKIEFTDVRILMLAWKMNAQRQGYFTREEWQTGFKALQVDTIAKLKNKLTKLENEVGTEETFEDFYSFAFRYCLTEEKQKSIDIETVSQLLGIVLPSSFSSKVASLVEYLKIQSDYKVINRDQWMSFLRFFKEVSFSDLEHYDANEAWPLILDNFVDWMKENCR